MALEPSLSVPLKEDESGAIRVGASGISLDSVIYNFKEGATADEIVSNFPTLKLSDVHLCLAYYLEHKGQIDDYLCRREEAAREMEKIISEDPFQKRKLDEMTAKIRKRLDERKVAT